MKTRQFLCGVLAGVVMTVSLTLCSAPPKPVPNKNVSVCNAVTLYGEVTDDLGNQVIADLKKCQDKTTRPLYLYIDSPGGNVMVGAKIIDAMLASKRPVYTVDIGLAASMAAYIHSYGVKRYMLPHSILMFHHASQGFDTDDVPKLQSRLDMTEKMMDEFSENVSKRTGIPLNFINEKENTEWWILSDEAMKDHFIDAIYLTNDYPSEQKPVPPAQAPLVPPFLQK